MDRRNSLKTGAAGLLAGTYLGSSVAETFAASGKELRLAIIGVGSRGRTVLKYMLDVPGWKAVAICDINTSNLEKSIKMVELKTGYKPEGYSKGPEDYKRMLARDDFDAVFIATPAPMHYQMSMDSMLAGKHVGSEVPAAYTLDECWKLVDLKEKTGLHYMLLENYNFWRSNMMLMNMVKQDVFGKTYYAECSYIHNCSNLRFNSKGELAWRGFLKRDGFGNLYPTHAIGPIAKLMGINNGDRFARLTSYMSKPTALHHYAVEHFGEDSDAAKVEFKAGDMCNTQIQTQNGSLINIQYDSDSPRPMNNFYMIQGTKGIYDSRKGIHLAGKTKREKWDPSSKYYEKYDNERWSKNKDATLKIGHRGGDYFVVREFIESLIEDREPWIDIYDAVTWSAIAELSQQSIANGNVPVEFPDFTRGKWKAQA